MNGDLETLDRLLTSVVPHFVHEPLGNPMARTALHLCAAEGHNDCVQWLLQQEEIVVDNMDRLFDQSLIGIGVLG